MSDIKIKIIDLADELEHNTTIDDGYALYCTIEEMMDAYIDSLDSEPDKKATRYATICSLIRHFAEQEEVNPRTYLAHIRENPFL